MLDVLQQQIVDCRRCPRLNEYCAEIARVKRKAYRDQNYWGRPVPSFGDANAKLMILGLAPGAHGANRTGRVFILGDSSGVLLYRVLHATGFASQPVSTSRDDGLLLTGAYITAAVHCAPPGNKPLPDEIRRCRGYLERELDALPRLRVVVALGKIAFDTYLSILRDRGCHRQPLGVRIRPQRAAPDRRGPTAAAELVSSEPAEHVHRQAHRSDAARRVPARA